MSIDLYIHSDQELNVTSSSGLLVVEGITNPTIGCWMDDEGSCNTNFTLNDDSECSLDSLDEDDDFEYVFQGTSAFTGPPTLKRSALHSKVPAREWARDRVARRKAGLEAELQRIKVKRKFVKTQRKSTI